MPRRVSLELRIDGPTNMLRDSALRGSGSLEARVYTWDAPWVSLGSSQNPEATLFRPEETLWVVRPTGGGAVLHGHDVTMGMALTFVGSVRHAYRAAAGPIVRALNAVGVPAVIAEDVRIEHGGLHLPDCFASISRNDIVDPQTGLKRCGCALHRTRDAILVQASIPAGEPLLDARNVIFGGAPASGPFIDPAAFREALEEAVAELLEQDLVHSDR